MLKSIRNQIFVACLALSLIAGGVGVYGLFEINSAGDLASEMGLLATDMYDKPLMAINHARLASFTFSEMNNEALRRRLGGGEGDLPGRMTMEALSKEFFEDLAVASQRTMSPRAAGVIGNIEKQVREWNDLRLKDVAHGGTDPVAMDKLSGEIIHDFDRLTELTAEEGFSERARATKLIDRAAEALRSYRRNIGVATLSALAAAFLITFLLVRRIVRPLSAAAAVANRIAEGAFDTAIPQDGSGETGVLLRSMTVMQTNIREMMEREAAQRRSAQNRLVDAIEGSREGMILVDADRRIAVVNSQVHRFFPSLAGRLVPGVSFANAFAAAKERPANVASDEDWLKLISSDAEIELANGRWLRISESSTQEGGWFLFMSDITPIKEREVSLTRARQEAESANIAKGNFLATMGHELRTPLNAVIGFSEMIAGEQLGPLGNPSYVEYAGDVVARARHLLAIINDVLELAKSSDGKLKLDAEIVDLTDIIEDCARASADQCAQAGLTLNIQANGEARYVWADEGKLRQIVNNLMSNAIKFSPSGGRITLESRLTGDEAVELTVADTGIGMRPEDIATALAPFGQIDSALARRYDGAGLGLPLTKAFVDLHGGKLNIKSIPGEGTKVRVLLREARHSLERVTMAGSA